MTFPSDLEIARKALLKPLDDIAHELGIGEHLLEPYGESVVKVKLAAIDELAAVPNAKYVVVTAVTPTPLGEGKTTTTVGLGQGFRHIGKRATVTIRQPSMGPTFGIKGGAAGGGYSQVVPMEVLNLHLTGDMHAVTAAHNMLSAMIDNHLYQGNELGLDQHNITWRRVLDVNDRALRNIVIGLGSRLDGVPRQTGFDITAASEVMATLALSTSLEDLRARLGRIVVGYTSAGDPVTADQLSAAGSMAVILRDAIKPNLLQTLENTPVLVHTGPFGNIATGNSSVVADLIGIHTGDYLVTEAGFGADMGAERFFNIKCRASGLRPDAAVVVTTVRALKAHSGKYKIVAGKPLPEDLLAENPDDVLAGAANLRKQIENVQLHGVSPGGGHQRVPDRPPLRARRHPRGRCRRPVPGPRCARTSPTAAGARPSLPRRSRRPPTSPATSASSTTARRACGRRSRPSRRASTAPTAWSTRRRPASSSPPTRRPGSARCRCASPRRTYPSPRTPRSRAPRPAGHCRCGRSGPRSAPASSTRSAARCGPCRGSARTRRPPGSTSMRTARSWG
jgi:hypothetical protein